MKSIQFKLYCTLLTLIGVIHESCNISLQDVGGGIIANTERKAVEVDAAEQLFMKLFKKRRLEQLEAVKGLLALDSYEKQYKMVMVVAEKVFSVIQSSRVVLEGSGYIPGNTVFPKEEHVLDALANILENTALFGDMVLRLPDITRLVLAARREWQVLLQWSLGFTNHTRLLDRHTATLIYLVNQELNITERNPDYVNPYRRSSRAKRDEATPSERKYEKKKRKKEKKKGPRMTKGEL